MLVLTLVANSTLLNYIRRNYRTVLRACIVGMVLTRQKAKNIQQFNVTAKRWGAWREGGGGGSLTGGGGEGESLTGVESDAYFSNSFFYIGRTKRCGDSLS